jgi:hypothetical protein
MINKLSYNEHEVNVYVPNEIFQDLKDSEMNRSNHLAFAYSYYYLCCWLYRYCKYGHANIDVKMVKGMLGYSPNSKDIDFIIKKNGILDQMGYTFSSTDYPIAWDFNNGDILFTMLSELEDDIRKMVREQKGKNYKIKIPVKGLWRDKQSEDEGIEDGTFYDISNTHMIPYDVFDKCMNDKELGCTGFYLYGYLKYRCQWHEKYNSSFEHIGNDTGVSKNTVEKYLFKLEQKGLVNREEGESRFIDGQFKRDANTYKIA